MRLGIVGYPGLLVLTPPPMAPPHFFFTLFAIHANRGSRGGTLMSGRHGFGVLPQHRPANAGILGCFRSGDLLRPAPVTGALNPSTIQTRTLLRPTAQNQSCDQNHQRRPARHRAGSRTHKRSGREVLKPEPAMSKILGHQVR